MEEKADMIEFNPERFSMEANYAQSRDPVMRYLCQNFLRLTDVQQELVEVTMKQTKSRMLSSIDEMQLLYNLAKSIRAQKTLDIGVFTGYSALTIAMALPEGGKVVALDIDEEMPNIGKPFWEKAGVADKIDLRIGAASDTLEALIADEENLGSFDFAFIDAEKTGYDGYYEACLKLLRPGGIIALDNMLLSGRVADDEDQTPEASTLRNLTKKIHADERVDVSFLTVGDGTILVFKR